MKGCFQYHGGYGDYVDIVNYCPPFCKSYIALYTYWNISGRTQWLSLRSTCQYSFIVKLS